MPSDRRLKANRRNAALGGPKTEEGRAAVRLHALKQGGTAATPVLPGEDTEALKQLRDELFRQYRPATPTEQLLLEEFVTCSWRLLRLRRVETEMWAGYIISLRLREGADRNVTQQESDRGIAATLAETPASHMTNFFRYERTTTRDFYRALEKLEALQRERRRAEAAPASDEVSVNGIGTVSSPSSESVAQAENSHPPVTSTAPTAPAPPPDPADTPPAYV
jgi:hypothetical protein